MPAGTAISSAPSCATVRIVALPLPLEDGRPNIFAAEPDSPPEVSEAERRCIKRCDFHPTSSIAPTALVPGLLPDLPNATTMFES